MQCIYEGELTIKLSKSIDVVLDDKVDCYNLDLIHQETTMLKEIIELIKKYGFTCHDNNLSLSINE